mmetsp:Transcript_4051/g.6147  ORF Transcript_4051/g.6147 Transcript_4051/m.6147 type:complete len:254 (+) Transcript_4051:208-969(+)
MQTSMPALIIYHSQITERDVLCGRGGLTNHHEGNRRFRSVVASHQGEYRTARKHDKADIARRIVALIRDQGGRFLKSVQGKAAGGGHWVEIGDKKAREKTSQALREGLDVRHSRFTKTNDKESSSCHPDTVCSEDIIPPSSNESVMEAHIQTTHTGAYAVSTIAETIHSSTALTTTSPDECDLSIGNHTNTIDNDNAKQRCESPALVSEVGSVADCDPLFFLPFDFDSADTVTQYELDLPQITYENYSDFAAV